MVASALMVSIRFSTRSRRLENTIVPPVTLTCSIVNASPALGGGRLGGRIGLRQRSRCSGRFSTGRTIDEFGDLRPARPHARQRHVGLDAAGGQAVVDVAVLRVLQRDVVQRDVERRPQADLGSAVDGEPVAGLALDPLLRSADVRKPEGMPITSSSAMTTITAAMAAPAIFSALISTFQTGQAASISAAPATGAAAQASLSRKRDSGSKQPKIFRGCRKVM